MDRPPQQGLPEWSRGHHGVPCTRHVDQDNEVYENNPLQTPEDPMRASASGMKFGETGTLTIRNNYVHHNFTKGIWIDHCRSGNLVTGNTATDNVDDGIMVEVSAQTRVTGNTVERNAIGKGFPSAGIKVASSRTLRSTTTWSGTMHEASWGINP